MQRVVLGQLKKNFSEVNLVLAKVAAVTAFATKGFSLIQQAAARQMLPLPLLSQQHERDLKVGRELFHQGSFIKKTDF